MLIVRLCVISLSLITFTNDNFETTDDIASYARSWIRMIDFLRYLGPSRACHLSCELIACIILHSRRRTWRNWFLRPSVSIPIRHGSCSTRACEYETSIFFTIYKTCTCINAGVPAVGRGAGCWSTFRITFTHNFETDEGEGRVVEPPSRSRRF